MDQTAIKKAAHCFRTDEQTIINFCTAFFSAKNIYSALIIMNDFIEAHDADPELLEDFISYVSNRGENNGT